MKKSGFTLVELLGVLVIIGVLSAISVAIYTNSISSSRSSLSDFQKSQLEKVARTYVAINTISFNNLFDSLGENACVSIHVRVLNHEGLLMNDVFDPKDMTNSMLDSYVIVSYDNATSQYIYEYNTSNRSCAKAYCMVNNEFKGPVDQSEC